MKSQGGDDGNCSIRYLALQIVCFTLRICYFAHDFHSKNSYHALGDRMAKFCYSVLFGN